MKHVLIATLAALAVPASTQATDLTVRSRFTTGIGNLQDRLQRLEPKQTDGRGSPPAGYEQQMQKAQEAIRAASAPRELTTYMSATKSVWEDQHMRAITDIESKTRTTIQKHNKTYWVETFEQLLRQAQESRKQREDMNERRDSLSAEARELIEGALGSGPVTLKPTGRTETILGYAAQEYVGESNGKEIGAVWITEEIEEPTKGRTWEALQGLYRGTSSQADFGIAANKLHGLVLRSSMKLPTGEQERVVVEIVKGPIPADVLAVPEGYTKVEPPAQRAGRQ